MILTTHIPNLSTIKFQKFFSWPDPGVKPRILMLSPRFKMNVTLVKIKNFGVMIITSKHHLNKYTCIMIEQAASPWTCQLTKCSNTKSQKASYKLKILRIFLLNAILVLNDFSPVIFCFREEDFLTF